VKSSPGLVLDENLTIVSDVAFVVLQAETESPKYATTKPYPKLLKRDEFIRRSSLSFIQKLFLYSGYYVLLLDCSSFSREVPARACTRLLLGDRVMLSAAPNSTLDWAQVGHRCGPRVFDVKNTSRFAEPHSQQ
jgi:hypothetical protein